jgi:hypothetical protein
MKEQFKNDLKDIGKESGNIVKNIAILGGLAIASGYVLKKTKSLSSDSIEGMTRIKNIAKTAIEEAKEQRKEKKED